MAALRRLSALRLQTASITPRPALVQARGFAAAMSGKAEGKEAAKGAGKGGKPAKVQKQDFSSRHLQPCGCER